MSFSRYNATTTNKTSIRTPEDYSPTTGMCTVCTDNCNGPCEVGQSALRGPEVLYPTARATSQAASEKDYPVDLSHLNINGRCFGAYGSSADQLAYCHADICCEVGAKDTRIKLRAPYIFPAMAKLNWKGYFGGAALSGVMAVIGEDMPTTDPNAAFNNGKITKLPLLHKMHEAFYQYYDGHGALMVQANPDDERLGLLEYAVNVVGFEAVELKVAQAAKGIQGMGKVPTIEKAIELKKLGYTIDPDPESVTVQEAYGKGMAGPFYKIGKLPAWTEDYLIDRVKSLRAMGVKFVAVKTGPFRISDMARLMLMASKAGVDLVTVDTAGGGTGNSPIRMMNEWGYPTVYMLGILNEICEKMSRQGFYVPDAAIAGGFAFEDQIFKGLALGSSHVKIIGIGRAAMAAAMVGENAGSQIKNTDSQQELEELAALLQRYGTAAFNMPAGALGVYRYVQKTNTGLQQLMALCRKYTLANICKNDLMPLTQVAAEITGLSFESNQEWDEVDTMIRGTI
ncbi:glutamate synthase-related protein [Anoxynatronum buryatiense]|uniref:Glutamate synthase (NADPH) GltB2 subunit n=1 Tax=Anoxynatronum buryatiense TaxID=489973 RepID=A0AA45WSU2_9CLOT|nr:glutamate synthase-related protein [Anoxynatronum buryatiense]SMP38683.1 glutamate synthase (NADPH) GltB2 subunit [Anoxynatronum buryatiense]